MWMLFGVSAGVILGFYDYWTKKAMDQNTVVAVVFWSSLFGALAWGVAFLPMTEPFGFYVDISETTWRQQGIIMLKGVAMTLSWLLAYYSVRELPMSFSGAVRASGPLWTMVGGLFLFGELLTPLQLTAVIVSVMAYYGLSQIGRKEGIRVLHSWPMFMMLAATILSAMTTVYDKFIVQSLNLPIYNIQAYSAVHRFILAGLIFAIASHKQKASLPIRWTLYVPLVGLSWVAAELVYFFAIAEPEANVTYLSIFRRTSLVVGFGLSIWLIGESNVRYKSIAISLIVVSTVVLIVEN